MAPTKTSWLIRNPGVCIVATLESDARRYIEQSYHFVTVGSDLDLLVKATDGLADKAKSRGSRSLKAGGCAPIRKTNGLLRASPSEAGHQEN
jgi:hypothetical protein